MSAGFTLFEASLEVGRRGGGIPTVLSTKAATAVKLLGERYIAMGPWVGTGLDGSSSFDDASDSDELAELCRDLPVPVRVGRWRVPGRPRTILVGFSALLDQKDAILAALWERFKVDSLFGGWEYIEPVLFGHACGLVLERLHNAWLEPRGERGVAAVHEWTAAAALLHLRDRVPGIATVLTLQSTALGTALSASGRAPAQALGSLRPEDLAESLGVRSKHSIEGVAVREADVFFTPSSMASDEAQLFHGRAADTVQPNGLDLAQVDRALSDVPRDVALMAVRNLLTRFLAEDASECDLVAIAGRDDPRRLGLDLLLDALQRLARRDGRRIVLLVLSPQPHAGIRRELRERLHVPLHELHGAVGLSTHTLLEPERDPVHMLAAARGFDNAPGRRVRVVYFPTEPGRVEGLLDLSLECLLQAMDLVCVPSSFVPWGYLAHVSLAVGVPAITSDRTGLGRWLLEQGSAVPPAAHVVDRVDVPDEVAAAKLADAIESSLRARRERKDLPALARSLVAPLDWHALLESRFRAWERALTVAVERGSQTPSLRPAPEKVAISVLPAPEAHRPRLVPFRVGASLPEALRGLSRLARNLWWCWNPNALALFERLSPEAWEAAGHNPMRLLRSIEARALEAHADDPDLVAHLEQVLRDLDDYVAAAEAEMTLEDGTTLGSETPIAYLCAEFGLHESLHLYGGGLGVLAGDHLKAASDLGIPLVGVGLLYRKGYVRQRLTAAGEQVALETEHDPRDLPLSPAIDATGKGVEITLRLPTGPLLLRAWRARVGRVPLYLLDSDQPENRMEDRSITHHLYGGDAEHRVRQEVVLGVGGARLLEALGIRPAFWHMNEGHPAFSVLERLSQLVTGSKLSFDEALEVVRGTTGFTTHTPLGAGHDRFSEELVRRYLGGYAETLGVSWRRIELLGHAQEDRASFNMTYLALATSSFWNGVSRIHGDVSRALFRPYWPGLLPSEVPVEHVTNGVHLPTWTDPELGRALGATKRPLSGDDFAAGSTSIDSGLLWQVKQSAKRRLVESAAANLERSFLERKDSLSLLERMRQGLDDDALFIGFARRFTGYKRASLLFRDIKRLQAILTRDDRPVRILFAGKAHPNDAAGRDILRRIADLARSDAFVGRVFLLEDYDMELARDLVRGVDLWLNTPLRGLEASGTSGMKAAANAGLNLSILDGWWVEAADGMNGWSIGELRGSDHAEFQDELDAAALYRLLEEEVVPLFFERDERLLPTGWLERVRRSLRTVPPFFSAERMVREYFEKAYAPGAARGVALAGNDFAQARVRAERHNRLRAGFGEVTILAATVSDLGSVKVGDPIEAHVDVRLGRLLTPEDVRVELVVGPMEGTGEPSEVSVIELAPDASSDGHPQDATSSTSASASASTADSHRFAGSRKLGGSGSFGYGIRVRCRTDGPLDAGILDLVRWA